MDGPKVLWDFFEKSCSILNLRAAHGRYMIVVITLLNLDYKKITSII